MGNTSVNILTYILEDDQEMHEIIKELLEANGIVEGNYDITHDPSIFLQHLNSDINICVIDHRLNSNVTGLDIIKEVKKKNEDSYVIIITGQIDYRVVVKYLREGADDYVDKNDSDYLDDLVSAILKGFVKAKQRIEYAKERALFKVEMEKRAEETQRLINKLKKG